MFDPEKWEAIVAWQDSDLARLPSAEDDRHEYKASATRDNDLSDKVARAASAFWNSGGGLFVAGVGDDGKPDGGIPLAVGRQSRRDWLDQAISRVSPRASYAVQCVEGQAAGLNISAGNAVVLVGFGNSEAGPHMAPDNRYYLRAGAHSLPASHFLVEAIHARRGLRTPMLRHVLRCKPENNGILQLGLISLSDAPALNVELTLIPIPKLLNQPGRFPFVVPVIARETPFYLDFQHRALAREQSLFKLTLKYADLADRVYESVIEVDIDKQTGPNLSTTNATEKALDNVADAIKKVADAIRSKK